jgi:TRAP transporter TAXI family solute receptor
MKALHFLAAALAAATVSGGAGAQTIGIISTQPGSHTHSSSTAVAKAISDKTGMQVRVQPQGASPQYAIAAGTGDFGLSNSFDSVFFVTGTGEYEGEGPRPNIRIVGNLTPLFTTIFVKKDSPIKTVADLKGQRIPGGFNAQKTIARILSGMLATANLSYDSVRPVMAANIVNSADDFGSGKSDAFTFALGSAKVKEIDAKVGGLRALSFDPSPAAVARMQKILPGAYTLPVKPAPALDGVLSEINAVAFDFLLNTNDKVSEEIVYKVTKAIYEGRDIIVATFPALRTFDPAKMGAKNYPPLQYHPGAIKFYKEIGKWPPVG